MARICGFVLLLVFLCLPSGDSPFEPTYAKDKKPTAEEVVAKHLESIGSPEVLAGIKSRSATGLVSLRRPVGTVPQILPESGKRTDDNNLLVASEGRNLGMVMKFYDQDYVGEHLAFDGKDVTIAYVYSTMKSTFAAPSNLNRGFVGIPLDLNKGLLGGFIDRSKGLLSEGFISGTLSTAWPLLNTAERKCKLQYELKDYSGVKLHQLTYIPKSRRNLDKIVVHMFFNFESYRHVMTEYLYMGLTNPEIIVLEKFGSYRNVDGLMLPHSYSIEFNVWRGTTPTLWSFEIKQLIHNGPIDPQVFHVKN
jgi:hypothetical protein